MLSLSYQSLNCSKFVLIALSCYPSESTMCCTSGPKQLVHTRIYHVTSILPSFSTFLHQETLPWHHLVLLFSTLPATSGDRGAYLRLCCLFLCVMNHIFVCLSQHVSTEKPLTLLQDSPVKRADMGPGFCFSPVVFVFCFSPALRELIKLIVGTHYMTSKVVRSP